jgi:general secretion pathway protein D
MPLGEMIVSRLLKRPTGSAPPDCGRGGSLFLAVAFSIAVVTIPFVFTPERAMAVRIAGEEQPAVTSAPRSPAAAQPAVRVSPMPRRPVAAALSPGGPVTGEAAEMAPPVQAEKNTAAAPEQEAAKGAQPPEVQAATPPPPAGPAKKIQYVTIDFDNVDIQVFVKFVSELTGRNFVIDDKVRGKVTVISPKKIAVDEVYKVFESVMEIYGFALVPAGDVTKVILSQDARGKNLDLVLTKSGGEVEDKMVTQIISLEHASADEMKKILDPLISKTSIILSYPPTGMLIVTDVQSNIKRLQNIVTALDVEGVGEVISYIPLRSAYAAEIAKSLTAVFPPQRPGVAAIRIVADERTNSLILMANEQYTGNVKKLISLMDKEIPRTGSSLHVYRLQNGNAEDMVKVLMNIPKDVVKDPKAPQQVGKTPVLSKDLNVVADKATNTLIITADRDDYRIIEEVIQKLDVPRPMVYIEALLMEVNVNKNFQVGVEWRGLKDIGGADLNGLGPNATALGMAGFSGAPVIPQLGSTGVVTMPPGFSLGVIGAAIQIGSLTFPNIGAVIQAYQNDQDVSILSTPQLLTLNNEDAEINVGQNVPYITRQEAVQNALAVQNTIGSSFEYKDVGVILKITPNINEDQFVRLKIDQQVTKISGQQTTTPTTLKRAAKTTVVVRDKETVVIGGLIDDTTTVETQQVPCLGDIPGLGWLFKTRGSGREKSNLFIFITPHIIRNQAEAAELYKTKREAIGEIEEGVIKMREKMPLMKSPAPADKKE